MKWLSPDTEEDRLSALAHVLSAFQLKLLPELEYGETSQGKGATADTYTNGLTTQSTRWKLSTGKND